jgi:hypothetical protein
LSRVAVITSICLGLTAAAAQQLTIARAKAEDNYVNSANNWLPACMSFLGATPTASSLLEGICVGEVSAIAFLAQDHNPWGCADIPEVVTLKQKVQVVVHYIEDRPNRMHESFKLLAVEAIVDAWPCRN